MTTVLIAIIVALAVYHQYRQSYLLSGRFIEIPTRLVIHPPREAKSDEEDYSDDLLNKLMGKEKDLRMSKTITVRSVIDMEEICGFDEWTTSKYEEGKVRADTCYLRFYDGTTMLTYMTYYEFNKLHESYNQKKGRLI